MHGNSNTYKKMYINSELRKIKLAPGLPERIYFVRWQWTHSYLVHISAVLPISSSFRGFPLSLWGDMISTHAFITQRRNSSKLSLIQIKTRCLACCHAAPCIKTFQASTAL